MEFLKELLSEFLGLDGLASSVAENRALIEAQGGEEIITLFEPGDVDIFAGNNDWKITELFDSVGGYFRNGRLVIWAEIADDGLPEDGRGNFYFRVNKALPFEFAGVGSKIVGSAELYNSGAYGVGVVKYNPSIDRFYVRDAKTGETVGFGSGGGRSYNVPFSFHYGCFIRFEAEIV